MADALLQGAHGLSRRHRLGADHVRDFEIQGHVFEARGRGALNLLVERAGRR